MAQFNWATGENPEPEGGLALDAMGTHLYIADTENERIRGLRDHRPRQRLEFQTGDEIAQCAGLPRNGRRMVQAILPRIFPWDNLSAPAAPVIAPIHRGPDAAHQPVKKSHFTIINIVTRQTKD